MTIFALLALLGWVAGRDRDLRDVARPVGGGDRRDRGLVAAAPLHRGHLRAT